MSEKELNELVHFCDVTIGALNDLEAEVIAYIQKRREEAQGIRKEAIEKLNALARGGPGASYEEGSDWEYVIFEGAMEY